VLAFTPAKKEVNLLEDSVYGSLDLLAWIESQTYWVFVVRSASNGLIAWSNLQYSLADLAARNTQTISMAQEFGCSS
jgi:hypothetical protein